MHQLYRCAVNAYRAKRDAEARGALAGWACPEEVRLLAVELGLVDDPLRRSDFEALFDPAGPHRFAGDDGSVWQTRVVRLGDFGLARSADGVWLEVVDDFSTREEAPPSHALDLALPEGRFPLELCLAKRLSDPSGREAVAAARLVLDGRPAAAPAPCWVPVGDRWDRGPRATFAPFGHAVDSGFTSLIAGEIPPDEPDEPGEMFEESIGEGARVRRWPGRRGVIAFTAGFGGGDGYYATWARYSLQGRLEQLAVDFDVLTRATWETVDLPLPLRAGSIDAALFARLGVTPVLDDATTLRLRGDVARRWTATVLRARGEGLEELGKLAPRMVGPRGAEPFCQIFELASTARDATQLRLRIYTGQAPFAPVGEGSDLARERRRLTLATALRDALPPADIQVTVDGEGFVLRGLVPEASDRELALGIAEWMTRGAPVGADWG